MKVRCMSKEFWVGLSGLCITVGLVGIIYAGATGGCECTGKCVWELNVDDCWSVNDGCSGGGFSAYKCQKRVAAAEADRVIVDCKSLQTIRDCGAQDTCFYQNDKCMERDTYAKGQCALAISADQCASVTAAKCEWTRGSCAAPASSLPQGPAPDVCSYPECIAGGLSTNGFFGGLFIGIMIFIAGIVFACGAIPMFCFVEPPPSVVYGPDGTTPKLFTYKGEITDDCFENDYGIVLSKPGYPKRMRAQAGGFPSRPTW